VTTGLAQSYLTLTFVKFATNTLVYPSKMNAKKLAKLLTLKGIGEKNQTFYYFSASFVDHFFRWTQQVHFAK
jgi:hypothetical protein